MKLNYKVEKIWFMVMLMILTLQSFPYTRDWILQYTDIQIANMGLLSISVLAGFSAIYFLIKIKKGNLRLAAR